MRDEQLERLKIQARGHSQRIRALEASVLALAEELTARRDLAMRRPWPRLDHRTMGEVWREEEAKAHP